MAGLGLRATVLEGFKQVSSSMVPTLAVGDRVLVDKLSLHWHPVERGDLIVFRQPCQPVDYLKRVVALGGQTVEVRCSTVYVDGKPLAVHPVEAATCSYDDLDETTGKWQSRPCSAYTETSDAWYYHLYYDEQRPERDARRATLRSGDVHDFPLPERRDEPPSCGSEMSHEPTGPSHQQPGKLVATRPDAGPCELQLHYVVPDQHVFVLGDSRDNSNESRYWGSVPLDNIKGRVFGIWLTEVQSGFSLRRFGSVD